MEVDFISIGTIQKGLSWSCTGCFNLEVVPSSFPGVGISER